MDAVDEDRHRLFQREVSAERAESADGLVLFGRVLIGDVDGWRKCPKLVEVPVALSLDLRCDERFDGYRNLLKRLLPALGGHDDLFEYLCDGRLASGQQGCSRENSESKLARC